MLARAFECDAADPGRPLLVAGAICVALGRSFVVVGGTAVNFHTGSYRPTDIDFVGSIGPSDRLTLVELGFRESGRHLVLDPPDGGEPIPVEFPGTELFGFATEPPEKVQVAPGVVVEVIALDDLMMDRVVQATDGTPTTRDEAILLAVAAYRRIDWGSLEARSHSMGEAVTGSAARLLPSTLAGIRRAARTRIRKGRLAAGGNEPGARGA